ncbi:MAG: hypothetical protein HY716_07305 [Planctomycetes bacterium]|nr:hypothetical protein [Planctomycetota bacterium]
MPNLTCESCLASFDAEGEAASCPRCGQTARADRSVRIHCTCGTTLKAPPRMRGRVITCPKCTRAVTIPTGTEAQELQSSTILGRTLRWTFAASLIPVFLASQGEADDPYRRVERSLNAHPEAKEAAGGARTLRDKIRAIPEKRADQASLSRTSQAPWLFGALALALFLSFAFLAFKSPRTRPSATAPVILACCIAGAALAFALHGVFSRPAEGESGARVFALALLGAAGAEAVKAAAILWAVRRGSGARWRDTALMGLAGGAAYGAGEAILYALSALNGVALARSYWIVFVSAVALQSAWGGVTGILLGRASPAPAARAALAAAPAAVLHFLFAFAFLSNSYIFALVIGLATFGLFHALHYWTEETVSETA